MPDTLAEPLLVGGLVIEVHAVPGRKSVRVTVERDARILAAVPPGSDRAALEGLIRTRLPWLYAKVRDREVDAQRRPHRRFTDGEGFYYLGRSYRLKTVAEASSPVSLTNGRLRIRQELKGAAGEALVAWYVDRGRHWLPRRIEPWATCLEAPSSELLVRPLGYRWGSCSARGTLNIHWAVMQLPTPLVDYVLVHELAHVHEPNHSPDFWRMVDRALPDYESRRARLEEWGAGIWLPGGN
ncbi:MULTISPECIES: SprT family zinc-dependent metalloprotease [unclassified Streptomyces]|uniref:M48 family metallopeptidase n=1 Tax=unclassified Streptomyces TaxID=2593676 RepID=UPI000DC79980|nr:MULTISPECIES: SprT family zinc-dependent metalloprotease [unclassified Streptomyces]AWZ07110.1 M48 family peptidase [Streptomyces sp. ICC4]AWZ14871.1 M48 family peptidase [Streptomyces sp. ICC1]